VSLSVIETSSFPRECYSHHKRNPLTLVEKWYHASLTNGLFRVQRRVRSSANLTPVPSRDPRSAFFPSQWPNPPTAISPTWEYPRRRTCWARLLTPDRYVAGCVFFCSCNCLMSGFCAVERKQSAQVQLGRHLPNEQGGGPTHPRQTVQRQTYSLWHPEKSTRIPVK
jgi:hypothetical protein